MAGKPGGAGQGPGDLSQEDRDLWRHVTRDAKPLKKREPAPRAAPEPKASAPEPEAPAPEAKAKTAKPARLEHAAPRPPAPALPHGRAAGVDRRSAQRLTRGPP
ncbi:MAG: hypothetical protein IIA68_10645, partial [Proteobacteria bacterium]|nr:hypothetical protein [Pseudomonadota bacterium]